MSKTVFILGAGASRETGAPLMNDFLEKADNLWKSGRVSEVESDFKRVFNAIGQLQRVHSKSELDIRNIESVFATYEVAKILNIDPIRFSGGDINVVVDDIINSIKILIVKTLEHSILFPIGDSRPGIQAQPPYKSLVELIKHLKSEVIPKQDCSIITFNYDINADVAFHIQRTDVEYGLSVSEGPEMKSFAVPLLKLHGSLNWGWCKKCSKIIPMPFDRHLESIVQESRGEFSYLMSREVTIIPTGSKISRIKHKCQDDKPRVVEDTPVIVPPTWNKTDYHKQLSSVWNRAAKELSDAENIFVIGYSFPHNDYFFHYLYALGSVGENPLKRFWVFDPNFEVAGERFRALLGSGSRDCFKTFPNYFSEVSEIIKEAFRGRPAEKRSERIIIKRATERRDISEKEALEIIDKFRNFNKK